MYKIGYFDNAQPTLSYRNPRGEPRLPVLCKRSFGCPDNLAPEAIPLLAEPASKETREPYDAAVADVYSVGLVMYHAHIGVPAFRKFGKLDYKRQEMINLRTNHRHKYRENMKTASDVWHRLNRWHELQIASEQFRELMERILEPIPARRLTLQQVLHSSFFLDQLEYERKPLSMCFIPSEYVPARRFSQ